MNFLFLPQAKKKAGIVWGEVTVSEAAPPAESIVEEDVPVPEESAIGNVFTEIQLLVETGPDSQLLQVLS